MPRTKLREAREAADLSQAELATLIGAEQKAVSAWETGAQRPQPGHRRRVREQLNNNDPELFRNFEGDRDETGAHTTEPLALEVLPDSASAPPQAPVPSESRLWVPSVPTLQDFIASNMAYHLQHIAHTDYATPDAMTNAVRAAMKEFDMKNMGDTTYQITRREAMCDLAILPMMALGANHTLVHRDTSYHARPLY